ncbi:SDR family oxidoreductase [Lentzea sp. NPDC006480]|uniref:SDR family NAD(P)-dependent oxidoreductase n=1 Tax=Lentzea sp. NPDC006480 TaxID=3157176 RepID=UPI0033B1B841
MNGVFPNQIEGRTALVTGAGNRLGRAVSQALAVAGTRVVLVGRRRETREETAEGLDNARVAVADTSDPAAVKALRTELSDEDISILINNAGVAGPVASLVGINSNDWDDVFAVNVRGVFLMCQAFLPAMTAAGRGDVINIASVSGKRPLARRTPYTASKMAVLGLTTTLAYEVGPWGVNVNSLSPGPVRGPRMERNLRLEAAKTGVSVDDAEQTFVSMAALQRMVEESEVAQAVLAMLHMPGMTAADVDLSAGMAAR